VTRMNTSRYKNRMRRRHTLVQINSRLHGGDVRDIARMQVDTSAQTKCVVC